MTDLLEEFEKLLKETKHDKPAGKVGRGVRNGSAKGQRVGVVDKKPAAGRPVQRGSVPAGHKAPSTGKNEHRADDDQAVQSGHQRRQSRGSTDKEWGRGDPVPPFEPLSIPHARYPTRFHPGELSRGDSVWYKGERYYIDYFPTAWVKGTFARIASVCPRPEEESAVFQHRVMQAGALSFCVPVDTLEKAPVAAKPYAKQPTKTAVERRIEMKKAGVTDIGDEVAVMLRECETLEQVYECASLYVGMSVADLHSRYGHLNHGQQRMNLGNKMRWKLKHGTRGG